MRIHIRDLVEYAECSMRYRFRHIDKVKEKEVVTTRGPMTGTIIHKEYDRALHQAMAHIFHNVQAGRYPSLYNMKQVWSKLWIRDDVTHKHRVQEIMSRRDERRRKESQGLRIITDMHKSLYENHGEPIAIDYEYEVKVGRHTLIGTLDLVRVMNNVVEIVDWKFDERAALTHLRNDLEITAASMAFRQLFGYTEERIVFYGLTSGKSQETKRDEKDYRALEMIMDNVERAIKHDIFFPVLNFKCLECPFERHCAQKKWVPK